MSKKALLKFQNIVSGSMAASITSVVSNVQFMDNIGLQLVYTGAPVGTFSVEISADHQQDQSGNVSVAGTWMALDFGATPTAAGTADQILISINQIPATWIRVKYNRTSGTGTLNGWIVAKEI